MLDEIAFEHSTTPVDHELSIRTARVVGRDPKTDIALIKVDTKEKLTAIALAAAQVHRLVFGRILAGVVCQIEQGRAERAGVRFHGWQTGLDLNLDPSFPVAQPGEIVHAAKEAVERRSDRYRSQLSTAR